MDKNLRDECIKCLKTVGHLPQLGVYQLMQLLEADAELARLKSNLTLHASVVQPQDVVMLSFKYDELKKELERVKTEQSKLLEWKDGIVRNSPTCPACAEQLFCGSTSVEHTCAVKENADLKRDHERLELLLNEHLPEIRITETLWSDTDGAFTGYRTIKTRGAIDAAQVKEGAK